MIASLAIAASGSIQVFGFGDLGAVDDPRLTTLPAYGARAPVLKYALQDLK